MTSMIERKNHNQRVRALLEQFPVVALIGPRQVGKSTLAREIARAETCATHFFDLEDPAHRARLSEPGLALRHLEGLVILDEIQLEPGLFPLLRVLADRPAAPARFLLLGSASPKLVQQGAQSLAGRIAFHRLTGFGLDEIGPKRHRELWLRGGFPRSVLAPSDAASAEWRRHFVTTFLERDLPALGVRTPALTLRRFWIMLAHYHAQVWNTAEFARAFGISAGSVRNYLDLLCGTFVVRQLRPFHANLKKRQVKAPKIYLEDPGILHTLLGLETFAELESHPKVGASFEGFALQQVIARLGAREDELYFWATHAGAELDLLVVRGDRRLGFEFKRTDTPKTTRSMHIALRDLALDRLEVVHAGEATFPLGGQIRALALGRLLDDLDPLGMSASDREKPRACGATRPHDS